MDFWAIKGPGLHGSFYIQISQLEFVVTVISLSIQNNTLISSRNIHKHIQHYVYTKRENYNEHYCYCLHYRREVFILTCSTVLPLSGPEKIFLVFHDCFLQCFLQTGS